MLSACPGDSSGESETNNETGNETDDEDDSDDTTTDDPGTSTMMPTTMPTSNEDSTGPDETSGTTGATIGCEPGSLCCNDAGEFEECWPDLDRGLVWELVPGGGNPNAMGAATYCSGLMLLGAGGWRLPTIDELRSLTRGCPATAEGGECGLTDDCTSQDCRDDTCDGCTEDEGPGMFGCYWNPNLEGTCEKYWSSSEFEGLGWLVDFNDGSVRQGFTKVPAGLVRCVAVLN